MLWIKPPFDHFALVIRKIAVDSSRAIVIAPEWTHLRWHKALQGITLSPVMIPTGKTLFQNDEGKVFCQSKWRTHAYLVDGSLNLENVQDDGAPSISEVPYFEIDATNPDVSGGVRQYSTKHFVIREMTRNLRTSHRALRLVIRADLDPENSEAEALLTKIVAKY